MTRGHVWAWGLFGLVAVATWWNPPWPAEQALHSSLTVVALIALGWVHKTMGLSVRTWTWALIFLTLHTIAARWIYSFVPYDNWTDALLGIRLSDIFGWQRNHFDRLVHFAYGLCLTMMLRLKPLRSIEVVLATSAAYELFEWAIAITLAPDMAEAYNGQQGDIWDPHKDMALALLGAIVATISQRRRTPQEPGLPLETGRHRDHVHRPSTSDSSAHDSSAPGRGTTTERRT